MIVRNWMHDEPTIISGDTLVVKAQQILNEKNIRALPVVDDGRLRGVITRASCLRASEAVTRTQDQSEINFFVNRLQVKDIMVRRPETVKVDDAMDLTLFKGQEMGVSQFPVVDGDKVVGIVSASEIFFLAAQLLGAWENWCGITLDGVKIEKGTLENIAKTTEAAGAVLHAIYPLSKKRCEDKRIILRFKTANLDNIVSALDEAGYRVVETSGCIKEESE